MKGTGVKRLVVASAILFGAMPAAVGLAVRDFSRSIARQNDPGRLVGGISYGYGYQKALPITMAQQKRNSRKHRNKLRARGQHRKVVR